MKQPADLMMSSAIRNWKIRRMLSWALLCNDESTLLFLLYVVYILLISFIIRTCPRGLKLLSNLQDFSLYYYIVTNSNYWKNTEYLLILKISRFLGACMYEISTVLMSALQYAWFIPLGGHSY